ncbi:MULTISPECIES: LysE/ArgO family amino acid transporter [Pseudoalteromonas]|uniref:LysE/ArgO family amino acid transporter n=1 Tax=Pseudoalteromonas TaxID=53246 RepID=UPI0015CE8291|nr:MULTISPECIES: LysE family transporter [unclassified Pseudoalteromonas]MBB1371711.1 LysE family transporter [Pseudoalteromonas sp. SR45-4]NYR13164.1 LysE family transporter [Pseudoalteromonas sp. MIP2626]
MSFLSGVVLGLSLIIAIGAQNIWILSQCMAGANRFVLATVCIICDAALILIGVFAANELQQLLPGLLPWLTWGGIAMLLYLAYGSAMRAIKGTSGLKISQVEKVNWWGTALSAFAISLLNPHVYLDTVLLLGNIGALQPNPMHFALGACVGSIIWFSTLVLFAPKLKSILSSSLRWRIFDTTIAVILCFVAFGLYNVPNQ